MVTVKGFIVTILLLLLLLPIALDFFEFGKGRKCRTIVGIIFTILMSIVGICNIIFHFFIEWLLFAVSMGSSIKLISNKKSASIVSGVFMAIVSIIDIINSFNLYHFTDFGMIENGGTLTISEWESLKCLYLFLGFAILLLAIFTILKAILIGSLETQKLTSGKRAITSIAMICAFIIPFMFSFSGCVNSKPLQYEFDNILLGEWICEEYENGTITIRITNSNMELQINGNYAQYHIENINNGVYELSSSYAIDNLELNYNSDETNYLTIIDNEMNCKLIFKRKNSISNFNYNEYLNNYMI